MIVIQSITHNADGSWTFTWNSDGSAFYRIVLWGTQLAKTANLTFTYQNNFYATFPPPLEIASGDALAPSEEFSPYFVVQWYGEATATTYLIQQSVDSGVTWTTIARQQESGSWIYTFQTTLLLDETIYNYRVIAVDAVDNRSSPRYYQRYAVCPPTPPDGAILISYDQGTSSVVVSPV